MGTDKPPGQYGDLLLSIVVLFALAIAGVVLLALSGTTWGPVLALTAAAEATLGIALAVRGLVADADGSAAPRGARRRVVLLGAASATTLVLVLVLHP